MSFYSKESFADKIFYHIYPLGMGNCPKENNFCQSAGNFFERLCDELPRIKELGCNALYIGPLFESSRHGYDTVDYYHVERRLGNNQSFKVFCQKAHDAGFSIVLDAVFNHTGRDFFAFKDIQCRGRNSIYSSWYENLNFDRRSCYGDSFDYDGWAGCKDLVKLNLENNDVKKHIFAAVKSWIEEFKIDGLRLDAADVLDKNFIKELSAFCRSRNPNFWLMGEVVHGDYNDWCGCDRLDSVTNYQIYKSLWSAVDSFNFFELSYNLEREFGRNGMYKFAPLYNFVENHDVDRIASVLKSPVNHLHLVYALLFSIPGIPSVYYGGELGLRGRRNNWGDYELRPPIPPFAEIPDFCRGQPDLSYIAASIKQFSMIRKNSPALQKGDYREEYVSNRQFAFSRTYCGKNSEWESMLILCNIAPEGAVINLMKDIPDVCYEDLITGRKAGGQDFKDYYIEGNSISYYKAVK